MAITREQLEQLTRIYNTMLQIGTKGEDTLVMADCLRALEQTITVIMQSNQSENGAAPVAANPAETELE